MGIGTLRRYHTKPISKDQEKTYEEFKHETGLNFDEMSKAELQQYCDDNGIEYRKKDTNAALINMIKAAE